VLIHIAVRQGLRSLRSELPGILATRTDVLSPRMLRIIEDLAGDWRRLDERIEVSITTSLGVLSGIEPDHAGAVGDQRAFFDLP
jgi:hypothetical protein